MSHIPYIQMDNGYPTLYVKDQPFFALSGELHNSSTASLSYMEDVVWPRLEGLNMNTVVAPLYWETIEPEEDHFDFDLLDGLIAQAREHGMHLIFLWFGLWKNSESAYVPCWMKKDTETYFRVETISGAKTPIISPFCKAAVERDAHAFSHVMARIREIDVEESTVIAMQVENEIGTLGTSRDYCAAAEAAFDAAIPAEVAEAYQTEGTWKEAFAGEAEETFMAWAYARAVETITQAGRAEYPLPCYVNAWLRQYPWYAGSFPSGGPVCEVHRMWKLEAPSLFAFAPDIYVPYVSKVMDDYHHDDNPLLIPEIRKDVTTASYCLYAFGRHSAICYSPFGIEDMGIPADQVELPPDEFLARPDVDASMFDIIGAKEQLAATYDMIGRIQPLILKYRGTVHQQCFIKTAVTDYGTFLNFSNYDIQVKYEARKPHTPLPAGLIFELDENTFLAIGMNCTLTFMSKPGDPGTAGLLRLEEGEIVNGQWRMSRILNGDEKTVLNLGPGIMARKIEVYRY